MNHANIRRRDLLQLMGLGGVVYASGLGLPGCAASSDPRTPPRAALEDFFFLQLSDTHWGYKGAANPGAATTLPETVARINAVETKPDFVVFTGDLTQLTPDAAERRQRMAEFKQIVAKLEVPEVHFLPGEHDASLDHGEAYQEAFGRSHYAFDHKGVHFLALDNVSEKAGTLGIDQLTWMKRDLDQVPVDVPVVVLAHRPLFDLFPRWDWDTKDGAQALQLLTGRASVTVFYGHIHQEHHHQTGSIVHHAARSLVFPLPPPGAAEVRAALPWDPASSDHGLGHRRVSLDHGQPRLVEVSYKPVA